MSNLLVGLLSVALAMSAPGLPADSAAKTGAPVNTVNPNDPVEMAYRRLLLDDDAAEKDVIKWSDDADSFFPGGSGRCESHPACPDQAAPRRNQDGVREFYFPASKPCQRPARLRQFSERHPRRRRGRRPVGESPRTGTNQSRALEQSGQLLRAPFPRQKSLRILPEGHRTRWQGSRLLSKPGRHRVFVSR